MSTALRKRLKVPACAAAAFPPSSLKAPQPSLAGLPQLGYGVATG